MPGEQSRSKAGEIVCRVAGCVDKEGNQRIFKLTSYKDHLKTKHPEENANDPRGFCSLIQPKINFSCRPKAQAPVVEGARPGGEQAAELARDRARHDRQLSTQQDEETAGRRERSRSPHHRESFELEEDVRPEGEKEDATEEAVQEIVSKLKNIEEASIRDLEEVVNGGRAEELVVAIESALNKDMNRDEKVTTMSNIFKIVNLEKIRNEEELEKRALDAGIKVLDALEDEEWTRPSVKEAQMFKQVMTQALMPSWVRSLLYDLLTGAESKGNEVEGEEIGRAHV